MCWSSSIGTPTNSAALPSLSGVSSSARKPTPPPSSRASPRARRSVLRRGARRAFLRRSNETHRSLLPVVHPVVDLRVRVRLLCVQFECGVKHRDGPASSSAPPSMTPRDAAGAARPLALGVPMAMGMSVASVLGAARRCCASIHASRQSGTRHLARTRRCPASSSIPICRLHAAHRPLSASLLRTPPRLHSAWDPRPVTIPTHAYTDTDLSLLGRYLVSSPPAQLSRIPLP
ncbi:hypothetical protein FB451DRAFT_1567151 [Mycena latifolia]|nr:hypothetical protein FB451DRAFT_1567151 [Mycena latifolia]